MSGEENGAGKPPKDRSPSFPYIGLSKALERAEQLFAYSKRHEARIVDAAKPAWIMAPKSSSTLQTVAALLAFGLIEDSGTGEGRKIKISDLCYRALMDQRPGAREKALEEAARKPKLIAEYIDLWGDDRPPVELCISELTLDRNFTPQGARAFLRVFDDTIRYVSSNLGGPARDQETSSELEISPKASVPEIGDLVQVEAAGQIIFDRTRVRAVEGEWVFVDASEAAARMSDVEVLEKAEDNPPPQPPTRPLTPLIEPLLKSSDGLDRFTVDEGVVQISFPDGMSLESVDELEQFLQLFIKKAKRRANEAQQ